MGHAIDGEALSWEEAQNAFPAARKCAVEQLLHLWEHYRERTDVEPLWGDELEFTLIELDPTSSRASLLLAQEDFMKKWQNLIKSEKAQKSGSAHEQATMQWEWATYMVESTPAKPYEGRISDLMQVEDNMRTRRTLIKNLLESNQYVISICIFPQLGASHKFSAPDHRTIDGSTTTLPNELGCPLTRYQLLRNNISTRRLGRPETRLPIFRDEKTQLPFHDKSASADANTEEFIPTETQENNVYLEGMNLGLGSCSLQVTFQAQNEFEARWLHDQLIPLGPVMLALSAATPVWKGLLVDSDGRWQRFADCADDRTAEEMDELPQRWTYNRTYISQDKPPGLDNECERCLRPEGRQIKNQLIDGGMDEPLAVHFASILSRDPLFLTRDDIHNMDEKRTNIFDLLYSGTWPTVRLKPPMDDAGPGWRVEFRPIEIQLWDSDNAAFAIFMYLVSRAITVFHLNFYLPIAKVGDSMERSQKRDAVTKEKMWFRRAGWSSELCEKFVKDTATTPSQASSSTTRNGFELQPVKAEGYALMTLNEIINGENMSVTEPFPGLIAIVQAYLKHAGFTPSERALLQPYLDLIAQRATGENPTPARWIRSFVAGHEDYRKDSYVSEEICYDIMRRILELDA